MIRRCAAFLLSVAIATLCLAAPPLPALNIDLAQTTVSGISSGAFMAVQMGVAHSRDVRGVATTAGGPYYCASSGSRVGPGLTRAIAHCMQGDPAVPAQPITASDLAQMRAAARAWSAHGAIDDVVNLTRQTVWLFHGYNDGIVKAPVTDALFKWYDGLVPDGNVFYKNELRAAHAQVSASCGVTGAKRCQTCATTGGDFINACADGAANAPLYDAAGAALQMFYGPLQRTPTAQLHHKPARFDQQPYILDDGVPSLPLKISMAKAGYVFVPAACAAGEPCRLHIAFHGCQQQAEKIGTAFVAKAGFNEWAEANHIVVLYPQTVAAIAPPLTPLNPQGCWDWWGYSDFGFDAAGHYATRDGAQIKAVWNMAQALARGATPADATPAAGDASKLEVIDASARQIALVWTPAANAASYRIERDGQTVGTQTAPQTTWADRGLQATTRYRYRVIAIDANGISQAASNEAQATTAQDAPSCDPYFSLAKGQPVTRDNVPTTKVCP